MWKPVGLCKQPVKTNKTTKPTVCCTKTPITNKSKPVGNKTKNNDESKSRFTNKKRSTHENLCFL